MTQHISLLTFLIFYATILFAQAQSDLDTEAINQILYQHTNDESPGMAVGIVQDGKVVHEKYIGYAHMEHQAKVSEKTRFNIASNAKQFTAICILQLIEAGKLSLEDDIRRYVPDVYPNITDSMTIADLITHTSGVRDYCDLLALQGKTWWRQFIDNEDAMDILRAQKDLNFKPGTAFLYSNSNYILLAKIIEKVTEQSFSEVATSMFESFDMPSTRFLTHYGEVIPNRARPYGNWNGWQEEPSITGVHGDGALFTNLPDQLKWEQILQTNDGKYLSQKLLNTSQSPIANAFSQTYGYGLEFDTHQGLDYRFHNGSTAAYNATFLRFSSKNLSIVVMSNNRSVPVNYAAWQIAYELLDLQQGQQKTRDNTVYADGPDSIEKLKRIQDAQGVYTHTDGTIIRITEKDGFLYREMYQREPARLINEKGALFRYEEEKYKGLKMNFSNIGTPTQQFTLYRSDVKPETYLRQADFNVDRAELNGRFYNEETDTEIVLKYVEDNVYALTKNGRERKAKLILGDYLRMMNYYEIKIIRDEAGKVIGLNVDRDRIRNVVFSKM